jgi:hypothetical protein
VPPCFEAIHPSFNGVFVLTELFDDEAGAPPVVADRLHRQFVPAVLSGPAMEQRCRNHIVAIRVDVC